jgi:hypothetical protein
MISKTVKNKKSLFYLPFTLYTKLIDFFHNFNILRYIYQAEEIFFYHQKYLFIIFYFNPQFDQLFINFMLVNN